MKIGFIWWRRQMSWSAPQRSAFEPILNALQDALQGFSAESLLMVNINGCKLLNRAISPFFLSKGQIISSHNLPKIDLTMATELNEWQNHPMDTHITSNSDTTQCQLP